MKYYISGSEYVWEVDSQNPKADPVCLFQELEAELAAHIANALMRAYIDGFEKGVWLPKGKSE